MLYIIIVIKCRAISCFMYLQNLEREKERIYIYICIYTCVCVCVCVLSPWSRVLLEKLTGSQLVKKFPAFNGNRMFIIAFRRALHLSLSWARSIQSIPSHLTSWRSILILFSHLLPGLPSGLFPSGFTTKILYTPLLPHTCYMPRPSHSPRFEHPNNIRCGVQGITLVIM